MEDIKRRNITQTAVLLVIAILSATLIASLFSSPAFHKRSVSYLDEKRTTVMEISAAAIAASTAVSMIPGDAGTPLAQKLADLSGYAMIVVCALFLEKYLTTVTAVAAFRFLIPICCLILIGTVWLQSEKFKRMAMRIILISLSVFAIVPVSVEISRIIENTYQNSVEETIETAKEDAEEIQNNSQNQTILDQFINSVAGGAKELIGRFEKTLNNLIEALAVLIVTSCVIPLCVILSFIWIGKGILQNEEFIPYRKAGMKF